MKLTITQLKFFVFCLLNYLAINSTVAQNAVLDSLDIADAIQLNNNDEILKTPYGVINLTQTSGSVFRISGDELRKTAGDHLLEALRGRVPGLRITKTSNNPGDEGYSYILNGGLNSPIVLIDGQLRGLQVDLREIEEVLVLSDATFNSLLGNFGDNGIIYVITKGGKLGKPRVEVNYQQSINTATRQPNLLSASEYANVINQAANNDGLADIYSQQAINAYTNGSDPINYPNVDRQETYLNDFSLSQYASINVYGGTEKINYSAFVGYSDWEGLEKVGATEGNALTFRTKLDTRINKLIRAHTSVYGQFSKNHKLVIGSGTAFSRITGTPANAFPLKVGDTAYVVSEQFNNNLLSELERGGDATDYTSLMTFDIGLDFDFQEYVPGLKYDTYLLMNTFSRQTLTVDNTPGLYTLETLPDASGLDSLAVKLYRQENQDLNIGRSNGTGFVRTYSFGGNLSYNKQFDDASLTLNLSHLLYYIPKSSATTPDERNQNINLNGSYALKNKYIVYANMNVSTSSKFINENRTRMFPTVGAAWVASNEDFLQDNKLFDYVKFRASFGQTGTQYTASTFYYLDTWSGGKNNGTTYLGTSQSRTNTYGYTVNTVANEAIDWIVYDQFFTGVELKLLKKLTVDVNYFNIAVRDQVIQLGALTADAAGNNNYLPYVNYTVKRNQGFTTNITYSDTHESFRYYASVNAGYNKFIGTKLAEVQHEDTYRLQEGQQLSNIMGYISDGLFTAENIGDALPQFGEVQIGDVKYVDQNGDGVIDVRDQRSIGNSDPTFNYGINIGIAHKGFNLDIVGTGVAGYDINLNSSNYYKHNGLGNYFGSVNNDLPNGNANPRLSTITSINNYVNSDYWIVDGGYFRISNVELGYTLPKYLMANGPFNNVKLFLRGSNLAIFSKIKDLDPEDLNAGIGENPMMRNFVLGASINF